MMVNTDKLKGIMAERGYSAAKLAKEAEMNVDTLRRKINSGDFSCTEAFKLCSILNVDNPMPIFFTD